MTEPENFLTRWARRKAAAQEAEAQPVAAPATPATPADVSEAHREESDAPLTLAGTPEPSTPVFDPAKLPPIESITAETDIRAFLAPGVPADLTRAALRRAWASDPTIRDFVGLSENSWDFNAPNAVAGFGPLEMTEELRGQIARMLGGGGGAPESVSAPEAIASAPEERSELPEASPSMPAPAAASPPATGRDARIAERADQAPSDSLPHRNKGDAVTPASPDEVDAHSVSAKRLHGSALPK